MPIRLSPGCKCCDVTGCQSVLIGYTPTSQLSRGEWSGVPHWMPNALYPLKSRFIQSRLSDARLCAWESPTELQSGPGWIEEEESRYTLLSVIDVIDQVAEWELYGSGWENLPESQREYAIANGYLYPGCGFISREIAMPTTDLDWVASFSIYSKLPIDPEYLEYEIAARTITEASQSVRVTFKRVYPGSSVGYPSVPEWWSFYSNEPVKWAYKSELRIGGQNTHPLDVTWGNPVHVIANTKQPEDSSIVGVIDFVAFNGKYDLGLFDPILFSSAKAKGSGVIYGENYDANNPSTFLNVTDGDVVIRNGLTGGKRNVLGDFQIKEKNDVLSEFVLIGGGMQVPSPGNMPDGRKLSVYCAAAEYQRFTDEESWGIQLQSAEASRTRTYDEPTCRLVEPSACPCPNDSEIYPVTIEEGLPESLYSVLDKASSLFRNEPPPNSASVLYEIHSGPDVTRLGRSFIRRDLCDYLFLIVQETKIVAKIWDYTVPPYPYISYSSFLTYHTVFANLRWRPIRGRFVELFCGATVEAWFVTEGGNAIPPPPTNYSKFPHAMWLLRQSPIARYYTLASGSVLENVPLTTFQCTGLLAGTFTDNGNGVPQSENSILGDSWSVKW